MSFKVLAYITCKTWKKLTSCPNTLNWMISKTLINLGCLSLPLSGYIHKSFAFHNSNIHFPAFHLTTSGNSIHFCWNVPQGICTKILIIFLRWFQAQIFISLELAKESGGLYMQASKLNVQAPAMVCLSSRYRYWSVQTCICTHGEISR